MDNKIKVYGVLQNYTTENILAHTDQLYDEALAEFLSDINNRLSNQLQSYITSTDITQNGTAINNGIKQLIYSEISTDGTNANSYIKNTIDWYIAGVVANAPASFDTLKEIADWIQNDSTDAAGLNSRIATNTQNIAAINNTLLSLQSLIDNFDPDHSSFYTKGEIDQTFNSYYTKSEVDGLLLNGGGSNTDNINVNTITIHDIDDSTKTTLIKCEYNQNVDESYVLMSNLNVDGEIQADTLNLANDANIGNIYTMRLLALNNNDNYVQCSTLVPEDSSASLGSENRMWSELYTGDLHVNGDTSCGLLEASTIYSENGVITPVLAYMQQNQDDTYSQRSINVSDIYNFFTSGISNYYTKSEVDNLVQTGGALLIGITTGTAADGGLVNTHINNEDVHVTAEEKAAWNSSTTPLEEHTYADFVELCDHGYLVPGKWYKITDYETTTTQTGTTSARWIYELVVLATKNNEISETAYAVAKPYASIKPGVAPWIIDERRRSNHFVENDANLAAWEIKYCLYNIKQKYAWAMDKECIRVGDTWYERKSSADAQSGNYTYAWVSTDGTTLYTEDDQSSDVYDAPENPTDEFTIDEHLSGGKGVIYYMKDEHGNECPYDFKSIQFLRDDSYEDITDWGTDAYYYTFSWIDEYNNILDASVGAHLRAVEDDETCAVVNNVIRPYYDDEAQPEPQLILNDICFLCSYAMNNKTKYYVSNNTFSNQCAFITFGGSPTGNVFEGASICNFRKTCSNNYIAGSNINFNGSCNNNIIGKRCSGITFSDLCSHNIIQNNCSNITFDKPRIVYVTVETGNKYITLSSTQNPLNHYIQNITIAKGVNDGSPVKTIYHDSVDDAFCTTYLAAASQTITV